MRHLSLDLDVDFDRRILEGSATLEIDNLAGAGRLWLDTRGLEVARVTLDDSEEPAEFSFGDEEPFMGRPMVVEIRPATRRVRIEYANRPDAAALQWLEPRQTAGGDHPFLLSQSQAILARTWIPCQDSPGIRFTYDATIRVPPGLSAVMSAETTGSDPETGEFRFEMSQPIPAYLLALAVGELEFRPLGQRSGVYAEPSVVEAAAWEFADTEKMMEVAEGLYGPYRWERYDIVVLPPSFPFGGMENPRMTFATPTILAGDRSLVSLVAHELAHSWSGNLVTNATWNDFWLNEGFTTYFELRIMEELYGKPYSEMLAAIAHQNLVEEMQEMGARSADTHLFLDLQGRDPDEGGTSVAYEKGYQFLRMLEETLGRERWDGFLRRYFDEHAFRSMTTEAFLSYLRRELLETLENESEMEQRLQIDAWVYGPGLPDNAPRIASPAFANVESQIGRWVAGTPAKELDTGEWTTHEWVHFVRNLPDRLATEQLAELDAAFDFSNSGNSEVLHAWLMQVVRHRYDPAYDSLERFLTGMGRIKFLQPLYKKLAATPEGLEQARAIYGRARPGYHPLAVAAVDKIVGAP